MAKKYEKLKSSEILLSSRGLTLAKMNQSHRKANWNCNALLQSNKLSFNAAAAKIAKNSLETVNYPGQTHRRMGNAIT
jgi:hypothetical protein